MPADALGAGAAVELLDGLQRGDLLAVDRDRHAGLEGDGDLVGARAGTPGRRCSRRCPWWGRSRCPRGSRSRPRGPRRSGRSSTGSSWWSRSAGPCSSANAMAFSRVKASRGPGRCTFRSGPRFAMPTSKRTWSLPLPVQPWATVVAPMRGGLDEVPDDHRPGERARPAGSGPCTGRWPAARAGSSPRRTRRARRPPTASTAPQSRARWRMTSRSSPPWPTSTATATTSAPVSSAIQPMHTEVSRPPE